MNHGDLTQRFNLRLTDEQWKFICDMSESFGVSPSSYMRILITSVMVASKKLESNTLELSREEAEDIAERGVIVNENIEANKHNIV